MTSTGDLWPLDQLVTVRAVEPRVSASGVRFYVFVERDLLFGSPVGEREIFSTYSQYVAECACRPPLEQWSSRRQQQQRAVTMATAAAHGRRTSEYQANEAAERVLVPKTHAPAHAPTRRTLLRRVAAAAGVTIAAPALTPRRP